MFFKFVAILGLRECMFPHYPPYAEYGAPRISHFCNTIRVALAPRGWSSTSHVRETYPPLITKAQYSACLFAYTCNRFYNIHEGVCTRIRIFIYLYIYMYVCVYSNMCIRTSMWVYMYIYMTKFTHFTEVGGEIITSRKE